MTQTETALRTRPHGLARHPIARMTICLVLAALFTLLMVNYSQLHGRLLARPTYDDVTYFNDALRRLLIVKTQGLAAFFKDFVATPPHSPWAAFLGMSSYAIFGPHDWAPYAGNGLVVLSLLLFVDYLMAGATIPQRIGAAAFALLAPMTGECIVEFRPDCAAGLATAMGIVLLLQPGTRRATFASAVCFAAALVIKPSVAPLTLALAFSACVLHLVIARWVAPTPIARAQTRRRIGLFLLPFLVLTVPFYVIGFQDILAYIHSAITGTFRQTYAVQGSPWFQAAYYLTGGGGHLMLGRDLWLYLALGAAQWLVLLKRRDPPALLRWTALNIILLIGYLLPAVNQPKNGFVGIAFQFLLLLMSVLVLRDVFSFRSTKSAMQPFVAWIAIALAVALVRWPIMTYGASGSASDPAVVALNRVQRETYQAIVHHPLADGSRVFTTAASCADASTIRYLARLEGRNLDAGYILLATDLSIYRDEMEQGDFVVAGEPGNGLAAEWAPSGKLQAQTLALIRSMSDFEQIAAIPALNGKQFYVFARRSQFGGFDSVTGLCPIEGPYPQWALPRVRWGIGPEMRLVRSCAQPQDQWLYLATGTMFSNQSIAVILNGHLLKVFSAPPWKDVWRFCEETVPLHLQPGRNLIELRYSQPGPPPAADSQQVLFRRLWIGPAPSQPSGR